MAAVGLLLGNLEVPSHWSLGFNDASVAGWALTLGYLTSAVLCLNVRQSRDHLILRTHYLLLAAALGFLGVNKQFDFHDLLLDYARQLSLEQGWFGQRRTAMAIALVFAMGGIAAAIILWWRLLKRVGCLSGALTGSMICFGLMVLGILLRFLPVGPVSEVLQYTVGETGPELWQFQLVEVWEAGFLCCFFHFLVNHTKIEAMPCRSWE